jgi:hypothetical protein
MPVLSIAETVTRPASVALDAWFPTSGLGPAGAARRAALVTEQLHVGAAIAEMVARMVVDLDADRLDELTEETTTLFARAEELRLAVALASRAADDTWLAVLDLD